MLALKTTKVIDGDNLVSVVGVTSVISQGDTVIVVVEDSDFTLEPSTEYDLLVEVFDSGVLIHKHTIYRVKKDLNV